MHITYVDIFIGGRRLAGGSRRRSTEWRPLVPRALGGIRTERFFRTASRSEDPSAPVHRRGVSSHRSAQPRSSTCSHRHTSHGTVKRPCGGNYVRYICATCATCDHGSGLIKLAIALTVFCALPGWISVPGGLGYDWVTVFGVMGLCPGRRLSARPWVMGLCPGLAGL